MPDRRREALKIIGAIGTTCAFPFSAGELYGQHAHAEGRQAPLPKPEYFTTVEFAMVSRLADLIIPATDTPGALAAGCPAYIDMVVRRNPALQKICRDGLASLNAGGPFLQLSEEAQIAMLTSLEAHKAPLFETIKSLTSDGYYTSKIGLVDELGYKGNTVMAEFPSCEEC